MILASRQTSRSTGVPSALCSRITASGLISTRSASYASIVRSRPLAIAAPAFQCGPKPDLERELAGRVVGQAEQRVGVLVDDRVGVVDGDLLDLDAALRGADEHQAPGRPVEHDREVVLLDDLGRRRRPGRAARAGP